MGTTVGFAYAETLGKWPLGDIAFGIKHYMRVQLMKPAFTVVRDESTKCSLLFIRGALSVKDRLTAATAAEVPFRHAVLQEGRVSNVVVGHAHCGMVAAARWIADQAIPCLSRAVEQFPGYRIKIFGHSMGAGIAAILTYMLRENKKLSSSSCIAFGPAACMPWDLAEFGKDFVTTVVSWNDLVPFWGGANWGAWYEWAPPNILKIMYILLLVIGSIEFGLRYNLIILEEISCRLYSISSVQIL